MSNDDDDDFGEVGCSSVFFGKFFHTSNGQVFLGTPHLFSALIIVLLLYYNSILLTRQKETGSLNIISFLILPSYLPLLYYFVCISAIFGLIDFALRFANSNTSTIMVFIYPLQIALLHWLYEGLSVFFTNYGAGIYAIQQALKYSFLWICFTFIWFFIIFSIGQQQFNIENNYQKEKETIYVLLMVYVLILFSYYSIYSFINPKLLYSRPTMKFYSRVSACFYGIFAILLSIFYKDTYEVQCPSSIILFILTSFIKPIAIYRALIIDSQYWQGLLPETGNPINEVWDHLGVETATTLADNLTILQQSNRKLPILHFGLIHLDTDLTFVAGGFSRVYFGSIKHRKVALKVLFAMELEPQSIKEFYKEASILYKLRHENIVECLGICVMPPALTMVLEHCKYGSLFDFLYKPSPILNDDIRTILQIPLIKCQSRISTNEIELRATNLQSLYDLNQNNESVTMNPVLTTTATSAAAISKPPIQPIQLQQQQPQQQHISLTHNQNKSKQNITTQIRSTENSKDISNMLNNQNNINQGRSRENSKEIRNANNMDDNMDYSSSSMGRQSFLLRISDMLNNPFQSKQPTKSTNPNTLQPHGLFLKFEIRLNMLRDAVNAIAFLHKQGYLHCDLKSLNFLVAENYVLKLADMGEVRPIIGSDKPKIPNPARNWSPPECLELNNKPEMYTVKSDIYGLAIVLSEILTSEIPYGTLPDITPHNNWYNMVVNENLRPNLPENIPLSIKEIIEKGWSKNPIDRPTAEEMLQVLIDHKIFSNDIENNNSF